MLSGIFSCPQRLIACFPLGKGVKQQQERPHPQGISDGFRGAPRLTPPVSSSLVSTYSSRVISEGVLHHAPWSFLSP
jgi:hypothetical protein